MGTLAEFAGILTLMCAVCLSLGALEWVITKLDQRRTR